MSFSSPQGITASHDSTTFDCGIESLNIYLKRFALTNSVAGISKTYVTCFDGHVAGYYALAAGSVEKPHVSERVAKGTPNFPIPVVLLTRLAVDRKFQGQGVGTSLLQDAVLRVLQAAEILGIRAFLAHGKDERAAAFYRHRGFEPAPTNPLHVMILLKDLKRTLGSH